ncbi:unnamed protein product [Closterium sp. Yama58-4]|nr:unnamed protein product [Closterium sp. Yama58-4]
MNGVADGSCVLQFDAATATEFLRLQRVLMRQDASRATNADTLSWLFDAAKARIDELAWRDVKRIRMTTDIRKHVHRHISAFTANEPTALAFSGQHPEWSKSVLYLLRFPQHHLSLTANEPTALAFSHQHPSQVEQERALPPPVLPAPPPLPLRALPCPPFPVFSLQASSPTALTFSEQRPEWSKSVLYLLRWPHHHLSLTVPSPLFPCVFLQANQPTALTISQQHPEWSKSVLYLLRWPQHQLSLSFTAPPQLRSLSAPTSHAPAASSPPSPSNCAARWDLTSQWADATWTKSLRSLTIKHVDWTSVNLELLKQSTPQLLEFTLYESRSLASNSPHGPHGSHYGNYHSLSFSFYVARVLRFRFPHCDLKPTLTSIAPLDLDHLSLYGQDRLVITSLRLASSRVAYLNGPPSDELSYLSSSPYLLYSQQLPLYLRHIPLFRSRNSFSWSTWLRAIAPKVEVLIVRHGVPIERVKAVWRSLRSLGIVVGGKVCHDPDWEAAVDGCDEYSGCEEEGDYNEYERDVQQHHQQQHLQLQQQQQLQPLQQQQSLQQPLLPPTINAPNLKSIFFPTRRLYDSRSLARLRMSFPSLALFCVIDRSYYWERKGVRVMGGPVVHERQEKSGVLRCRFDEKKRAKNVKEKMHSVNGGLVEGYIGEEDERHILKYQGRS